MEHVNAETEAVAVPPYDGGRTNEPGGDLPADRFLDRELSWLAFNERVLELAEDPAQPLLERVRHCGIFAANLDEFFMVRVAGLKRRLAAGVAVPGAAGLMPREQLTAIWERTRTLMSRHAALFRDRLQPELAEHGIEIMQWDGLGPGEQERLHTLFRERVFPVLTPLAVDPAHPFPYISGLSLNLAVVVRDPETGSEHFARVKVPQILPRFIPLEPDGSTHRFVLLEGVIAAHLDQLFPGMEVVQHHMFRVTRNEDLEVEEDDADSLLQALERELMRRRFGPPVRLEVEASIDEHILDLLVSELRVGRDEVFALPGPLDLTGLSVIAELDRDDLKPPAFVPQTHPDLDDGDGPLDVFAVVRRRDVLLHHPYEPFSTSVQRFIEQAAADPHVLAIKQTLYRTNEESPIVDALIAAAAAGKQVLVVVEIKARFDEEANIGWARTLEQAGCHVVYGFVGLKTHCKLSLVVREEADVLRRYAHIGTGNYNPKTARAYEDLGLLTADPDVTEDLTELFNQLSGYARPQRHRRLLVAPRSVRSGLIERIEREIAHHKAGRPARIRLKLNALADETCIDALYRASRAGVPVDLWVRGICALRPGVPGLSETIRVRSVLGRFLEHSRAYWFEAGGEPEVWIGSADLMHRNLDRRLEVLVRLTRPDQIRAVGELLDLAFDDEGSATWHLGPDGTWTRHHEAGGRRLLDPQERLIQAARRRQRTE